MLQDEAKCKAHVQGSFPQQQPLSSGSAQPIRVFPKRVLTRLVTWGNIQTQDSKLTRLTCLLNSSRILTLESSLS